MTVEFVDELPDDGRTTRSKWAQVAEQLRNVPGQWAFVGRHAQSVRRQISLGQLAGFTEGDFETTVRHCAVDEGYKASRADIYVRYVGEV